ncbi:hypothetical protein JKP88DRAFT_263505 [Tribonema minus]|uniref:Uncharacterized protein n=1 Tax=Tribonema minus TaxID=303371 RepID=A0A835Z289_9STRA|nr:hypothetical protein JKP88DRAFT_263505 [Tribonema minus]
MSNYRRRRRRACLAALLAMPQYLSIPVCTSKAQPRQMHSDYHYVQSRESVSERRCATAMANAKDDTAAALHTLDHSKHVEVSMTLRTKQQARAALIWAPGSSFHVSRHTLQVEYVVSAAANAFNQTVADVAVTPASSGRRSNSRKRQRAELLKRRDTQRINEAAPAAVAPSNFKFELARHTQDEARKLLSGKHLVMIGDSITRYQYLSLVNFLEHGQLVSPPPSSVWIHAFDDFYDFYNASSPYGVSRIRYYFNPATNVRVTLLLWFGGEGIRLHTAMQREALSARTLQELAAAQSRHCAPGHCNHDTTASPAVATDIFTLANDGTLSALRPHYLVLNCGLWKHCGSSAQFVTVAAAARRAVQGAGSSPRNVIWKTTTTNVRAKRRGHALSEDVLARAFIDASGRIMPAGAVSQAYVDLVGSELQLEEGGGGEGGGVVAAEQLFQSDGVHFQDVVYGELNVVLLNMLAA